MGDFGVEYALRTLVVGPAVTTRSTMALLFEKILTRTSSFFTLVALTPLLLWLCFQTQTKQAIKCTPSSAISTSASSSSAATIPLDWNTSRRSGSPPSSTTSIYTTKKTFYEPSTRGDKWSKKCKASFN